MAVRRRRDEDRVSSSTSDTARLAIRKPASRAASGLTLLMRVERWDTHVDGQLSEQALQHKLRALGYQPLTRANPAGPIASPRVHRCDRVAAVLAGLLKVTLEGESVILAAGDLVFVPAGAARRVETVGTSPVQCVEAVRHDARG
jgi:mannose-6-phosphate isomerase-like protein (cupin superfamily)